MYEFRVDLVQKVHGLVNDIVLPEGIQSRWIPSGTGMTSGNRLASFPIRIILHHTGIIQYHRLSVGARIGRPFW